MKPVVQQNHAERIITDFSGTEPLSSFLSRYFKQNRQIGSKDRKFLRALVYQYYRLGNALNHLEKSQALVIAHFLGQQEVTSFLEYWLPQFLEVPLDVVNQSQAQKLQLLKEKGYPVSEDHIFPLHPFLSEAIDKERFIQSLLAQPPLYIFLLDGSFREELKRELADKELAYEECAPGTFALHQNAPVTQLNAFTKGKIAVMDRSVQGIGNYLPMQAGEYWWDCCAGAGGKTLLMKNRDPETKIWISDNRPSILRNHQKRMAQYGYSIEGYATLNLEKEIPPEDWPEFDGILMDAPCSGSGTWLRTPENIGQCNIETIEKYQATQIRIASNALQKLKKGGKLTYITCSAFAKENEEVIQHLAKNHVKILAQKYIKGYEHKAETLFVAQLEKSV